MLKLLISCACVALALGQAYPQDAPGVERPYGFPYVAPYVHAPYPGVLPYYGHVFPYYHGYLPHAHHAHGALAYIGHFPGSCHGAADGLYYVDANSFAFCSNGIKSIQKCAEGSANPVAGHFHPGQHYGYGDFCSVNLAAH